MTALIIAAYSYLLGSVPFGYLLVRIVYGQDVRQTGSGNIGATNVSRTSPWLGVLTLMLDACKGAAAVLITRTFFPEQAGWLGLAALAAIIGHIFPLWLSFHGGKGVATGLGSFVVLFPKTILIMIGVFAVIFLVFRYVSLASVLTVALFPFVIWFRHRASETMLMLILTTFSCLFIVIKHHENIHRLLSGTEPRFQWRRG